MMKLFMLPVALAMLMTACGADAVALNESPYAVTVDYTQSLQEMIQDGDYDNGDSQTVDTFLNLEEDFSAASAGMVSVEVLVVEYESPISMTTEELLTDFAQRGLRHATLPELLALGAQYPHLQAENPIVALGSVRQYQSGLHAILYLTGNKQGKRFIDVQTIDGAQWGNNRFAAVRIDS